MPHLAQHGRSLAAACLMAFLAGCGGSQAKPAQESLQPRAEAPAPQPDCEAAQKQVRDELEKKISQLNQEASQVKHDYRILKEQSDRAQPDDVVLKTLVRYIYQEFEQGRSPSELIGKSVLQFGVELKGQPGIKVVTDPNQVDLTPVLQWVRTHPAAQIESIDVIPKSTNGYKRIDVKVKGGFHIIVGLQDQRLVTFAVYDRPMDVS